MRKLGIRAFVAIVRNSILVVQAGGLLAPTAYAQPAPAPQTPTTVITCVSKPGERQVCKADTAAGVALLRSTGDASCLLGKNWGYDDAGIWVSDGCGGEFVVGGTREASGASNFVGMFEAYGSLRAHLAAFKDDLEVQDNATRIGMNFATRGKIKVYAGTEWGVNLVQSETQFNLSGAGPGTFGSVAPTSNPVFLARLGFVGTDFGSFGKVAIGKQYAPHYDVASYTTDRFNVFGGQGSFAYVAGTDGGVTGTGRSDRAVQYRNTFLKVVDVAVQGQFRAAGNDTTSDGVGASLQLKILPGVRAGGTYTRTNWSASQRAILGLGGSADYFAGGARADWRWLELGFVYAHQHNGDVVYIPLNNPTQDVVPVVFDAQGIEMYGRASTKRFGFIGGYIWQDPKFTNPLLNPNFRTRYLILGAEWFFAKNGKVYSESRIDLDSVTATGEPGYSVFTIGFRYDFTLRASHQP